VLLQQIAQRTGGRYFRATASGEEIEVIAGELSPVQSGERKGPFEVRRFERFEWFAGFAFLALVGDFLLSERTRDGRTSEVSPNG
jgi:hypothetical protein